MKNRVSTLFIYLILITYPLSIIHAQNRVIDSLNTVLKTQKEDTNKVNTLNFLSGKLTGTGNFDSVLVYASKAETLANKLGYKKGVFTAYTIIGNAYEMRGDFPKVMEYDLKALAECTEMGDKGLIASTLCNVGNDYENEGNYSIALNYILKALDIEQSVGNKSAIARILGNAGNIYTNKGDYPKALDYDLKALAIEQELDDKNSIARNLGNIGVIYDYLGNYPKALEYLFKALALKKELGDKRGIAIKFCGIGNIYTDENMYDSALEYYTKGLVLFREIGEKSGEAKCFGNIGGIYIKQGNFSKALEYSFKALAIKKEIRDKSAIANSYSTIADTYLKMKNYREAKVFLDSSLALSSGMGEKETLKNVYSILAAVDSATGDNKAALEDYKRYIIYRDSLVNDANTKKIVQAQMNFEFEQKQAEEKAKQDKKDAVAEQERNKQIVIRNSFMGGFGLMIALAFFIFRGYRQKQKANIVITQQKVEVEKQKDLVEQQKALVEEKNKDILDSITYAKRLQDAILPPLTLIKQYLPDSFLLYKPKDIVAGDFYWMERAGNTILVAAADCTGHGVPGALVSVVCSNALNRTVKEFKITEPGKILDKVRELVLETFEKSEGNIQDGMDISLCCINTKNNEVQWSGAFNSLWYIQDGAMQEVPADKQPIGKVDKPLPFNTHNLNLQKGDTLYLFTDGYADQFGGPKGKKFKYKQLQQLIMDNAQLTMQEQKQLLEQKFEEWKGSLEQVDDVLVIGIRV